MFGLALALWKDERGQNIIEYALIVAVIVVLVVGAIYAVWSAIERM
jgi:Flp pilus assembly pilin Flp